MIEAWTIKEKLDLGMVVSAMLVVIGIIALAAPSYGFTIALACIGAAGLIMFWFVMYLLISLLVSMEARLAAIQDALNRP